MSISVQVLSLLKREDWMLTSITATSSRDLANATLSDNDQYVLLSLSSNSICCTDIYDCHGQKLSSLKGTGACISLAVLANARLAVSRHQDFQVFSVYSGQLLVTQGPHKGIAGLPDRQTGRLLSGLIFLDPSGAKLAFCEPRQSVVHLYSSSTLQALGTMSPSGHSHLAWGGPLTAIKWGVYSWVMHLPPHLTAPYNSKSVQVMRIGPGDTYTEVLDCAGQPQQAPALSPDGAYLCTYDKRNTMIHVNDVRTGQLMLAQDVSLPEMGPWVECTEMTWDGSGCQLLIQLYAFLECGTRLSRLLVISL